jgi:hypothetical protein
LGIPILFEIKYLSTSTSIYFSVSEDDKPWLTISENDKPRNFKLILILTPPSFALSSHIRNHALNQRRFVSTHRLKTWMNQTNK